MGSEQSAPAARQADRARPAQTDAGSSLPPSGSASPGASVCSDTELPYISYTLNRPIGDSPQLNRGGARRGVVRRAVRRARPSSSSISSAHAIVVVQPARPQPSTDQDSDLLRLQQIPMFLPIMRGTLGLPGARDPEVLEGVEGGPWLRLCGRYQAHLAACATLVATEQNAISARCREVDAEAARVLGGLLERQRRGARLAERLAGVRPLSAQLARCHAMLNRALGTLGELQTLLPGLDDEEPFIWTTG